MLDFRHVVMVSESACNLFHDLLLQLAHENCSLYFSALEANSPLRRVMKAKLGPRCDQLFRVFEQLDSALEFCEDRLLERLPFEVSEMSIGAANYELFVGFTSAELEAVRKLLERRHYRRGDAMIGIGEPATELFLLARGSVSVYLPMTNGSRKRLATLTAGMAFGEMAVLDRAPRSATILAEGQASCDVLSLENLESLGESHPRIKMRLLENLSLSLCAKLRKANREISLLV